MRIVRFLTFQDAKHVLSAHSTFRLSSIAYYWRKGLEPNSPTGDTQENALNIKERGVAALKLELWAATLLSCWTIQENDEISRADWKIFNNCEHGIAIVSTVDCMVNFLSNLRVKILDDGWCFKHGTVKYYEENDRPPLVDTSDLWLGKRKCYQKQREYRFAFMKESPPEKLHSIVFYVDDPKNYVQKIYFGPKTNEEQRRELLADAIDAELEPCIQNFCQEACET